jgi:hypothetical protein
VEQIIEPAIGVRDGATYRKGPAWKRHFAKGPECETWHRDGGRGDRRVSNALVARDGIAQHSTPLSIPLIDVYVDPRLDLGRRTYAQ